MNMFGTYVCVLSLVIVSCYATESIQDLGTSNNKFTLDLYNEVKKDLGDSENIFFSPLSINIALGMTMLGARGNTLEQMKEVLHLTDLENEQQLFQSLIQHLEGIDENTIKLANRLFGRNDYTFKQTYLEESELYYGAALERVDFSQTEQAREIINSWVEEKTEDKIEDIIPPGVLSPSVVLVLANAIYFQGNWTKQFSEDNTQVNAKFFTGNKFKEVEMMKQVETFKHARNEQLRSDVVELPYEGNKLSMFLVVPFEDTHVSYTEEQLTHDRLNSAFTGLTDKTVSISLPKFEVTQPLTLTPILKSMGMVDLMTAGVCNLTGIADAELVVSDVLHKAFCELNEFGTEAAAATVVVIRETAVIEPPTPDVTVELNRPALYFIRDNESGAIAFMGRLSEPKKDASWTDCQTDHQCPEAPTYTGTEGDGNPSSGDHLTATWMVLCAALALAFRIMQ